jgi:serine/threonine protein kinase/Tol biopolymer transport system component
VRSPADWSRLATLVDQLLDTPAEKRDALIAALSAGDAGRRGELDALRAECEREPAILSRSPGERFAALLGTDGSFPDGLEFRYRLTRELGHGGMATVFLARDTKHARDVAVKVMHPAVALTLGAHRFLAEIEMVAQMHHPHIVPLYDSGDANGALYYVMPFEPGLSLRHRLEKADPLDIAEIVLLLRDVCDALAYAHARGIVHRDIKPDNVLVSGRHALVADFGIAMMPAVASGRPATIGVALGTPAYMAPEQIAGEGELDHRTDIYAVGVLAYELLTRKPPFVGETRQEVFAGHLRDVPAPIVRSRPDAPPALAAFVMRCLEKRPQDRWQNAEEMVRALESMLPTVSSSASTRRARWTRNAVAAIAALALGVAAIIAWRSASSSEPWAARWSRMHIERITDFAGSEVDAAISRDGKSVAFLADRDGVFDAFVSEIGSGQFVNLTGGRLPQLFNEDVRNVGFTPNGEQVWIRVAALTSPASVSLLPTRGGQPRPFLPTAVMVAWSPDGKQLAYHETTPGDPIFVADADGGNARRIYIASPGAHSHYLTWSPDQRFLYFAHGLPPNEMDIWRIPVNGGPIQRITTQNSRVAFPVLLDDRTLVYTATDDDGTGPWLYMMDLRNRTPVRLDWGVEHFISIAAARQVAGQPRRLVATVSNPSVQLWSVPIGASISEEASASRLTLPTARSAAPRYAPDSTLWYLASRGGAEELWRSTPAGASELWKPSEGAIAAAPAVSPNGKTFCIVVRKGSRSALSCANADGSKVRLIADSLDVRGAPSWSPDGRWVAIGVREGEAIHVFKVPLDGGTPVRLVQEFSSEPVWSPEGHVILYSGTPRGRSVPVHAVRPDGSPIPPAFGALVVDRLSDSYRFLPDGTGLVVKLGGFRHQDFWLIDLRNGARRQLTRLKAGESIRRFDISRDGRRILFERADENSDVALIELPAVSK